MTAVDTLRLNFGFSPWLRALQWFVALLGAMAVLLTPAGWIWKCSILFILVIAASVAYAGTLKPGRCGQVMLFQDGIAQIFFSDGKVADVLLKENAWISRRLCVLALIEPDSRRQYHCVICASENATDQFRRLLKFLKMRTSAASIQKVTW